MRQAAELAKRDMPERMAHISKLRDRLIEGLPAKIDHVILTGHRRQRLPGNASFCVEFIEGESMLMLLSSKGIAVSSGSACTSRALKASHVLTAMNLPRRSLRDQYCSAWGRRTLLRISTTSWK